MRTKSRFNHPARRFIYDFMKLKYGKSPFVCMDVGVVSMVDYTRLRKEYKNLNFSYLGVDINPDIVKQAKEYLTGSDEICLWDIHVSAPKKLKGRECDIILVKHMLHYCKTYEVLNNLVPMLTSNGHILVVNNCNIYTVKNETNDNGEVLYAFGRWRTTYSEKAYTKYLRNNFQVKHTRFKSKSCKPYTIDVLQKK